MRQRSISTFFIESFLDSDRSAVTQVVDGGSALRAFARSPLFQTTQSSSSVLSREWFNGSAMSPTGRPLRECAMGVTTAVRSGYGPLIFPDG